MLAGLALLPLAPPALELTIASYNVRFGTANDGDNRWELRRPRIQTFMKTHPADVWGLQEALSFQVDELRTALGGFGTRGVGRDDGQRTGEHSAILFDSARLNVLSDGTFWLSDTPTAIASRTWGNRIPRICSWVHFQDAPSGSRFYIFNLHLDHESQPSREKSVELVLRRIQARGDRDPVIVTGDFNAGEGNAAVESMRAAGFRDSFRVKHPQASSAGTFNGFSDVGPDKIDYIFVDSHWEVRNAAILGDKIDGFWPSDHLLVQARLRLIR